MSRAVTEEEMTQGISRLEAHTAQIMEEAKARGIAVGVVDRTGRILYEKYFGYRDEEKKLPINRDTIFGMASVTKSFTALSIMQMQKDGILSVDDAVSAYIPEFTNKNQKEPVRLSHLMSHSGGYFPLPRIVVDKTAQEMGIKDDARHPRLRRGQYGHRGGAQVGQTALQQGEGVDGRQADAPGPVLFDHLPGALNHGPLGDGVQPLQLGRVPEHQGAQLFSVNGRIVRGRR